MKRKPGFGTLVIIGGGEDKKGAKLILKFIAKKVGRGGKIVVSTVASEVPGLNWDEYETLFRSLGVRHVFHLHVETREDAKSERALSVLRDADAVFFTGGDQLRITSLLGDTPVYSRVKEIFESGGLIAGTSAGASVMTETMMVSGPAETTQRVDTSIRLAPGFGLLPGVIIDQHFSQRGRVGRLVAAIAQNPRMLGVGLDEDAAIIYRRQRFQVLGTNAVHILDASKVSFSNVAEEDPNLPICVYGIRMHMMNMGDVFDCRSRKPKYVPKETALKTLGLLDELQALKEKKSEED
jgi:cyanophycinase